MRGNAVLLVGYIEELSVGGDVEEVVNNSANRFEV